MAKLHSYCESTSAHFTIQKIINSAFGLGVKRTLLHAENDCAIMTLVEFKGKWGGVLKIAVCKVGGGIQTTNNVEGERVHMGLLDDE